MTDRLQSIRIHAAPGQDESLVLCFAALLHVFGRDVDYDELLCLTGTAFMTSFAPGTDPAGRWNVHGRHAFIEPAARLYGLELRDLHPPDAAPSLPAPPEFDWHFRDSYLPFIETALARGEPVLAWMGWPPPDEHNWGLITRIDPISRRCAGVTPDHAIADLAASPVQVYTIAGYEALEPTAVELARTTLRHSAIILANGIDPSYGVRTGPAAVEAFADPAEAPAEMAQALIAATRNRFAAAERFFRRVRPDVSSDEARRFDGMLAVLRETIGDSHGTAIEKLIQAERRLAAAIKDQ